jgi:hypothetical protein
VTVDEQQVDGIVWGFLVGVLAGAAFIVSLLILKVVVVP